jgi:hypothetical protein
VGNSVKCFGCGSGGDAHSTRIVAVAVCERSMARGPANAQEKAWVSIRRGTDKRPRAHGCEH